MIPTTTYRGYDEFECGECFAVKERRYLFERSDGAKLCRRCCNAAESRREALYALGSGSIVAISCEEMARAGGWAPPEEVCS